MNPKADVLLVTATDIESRTVLQRFQEVTGHKARPRSIEGRIYFDIGKINGTEVFLTQSEMGTSGLDASLQAVTKGIDALNPAAVIMVGIAFGINEEKQVIGNILVATQLYLYDQQRFGTSDGQPKIILRGDKPSSSKWLANHLKSVNLTWDGASVEFGPMLSGEKLVDNLDYRSHLLTLAQEAIGGEMEGAGLYAACHDMKVDWILLKAICDWADGNKSKDKAARQQLAAKNAVDFILAAIEFTEVDWNERRRILKEEAAVNNTGSGAAVTNGGVAAGQGGVAFGGQFNGPVIVNPIPAAAASRTQFNNLPPQPYFFGRDKELASIAEAISPEARTWGALIDGPGGIGKTSLAIRAGHLAPAPHFDRKLFLSAKVRELTYEGEQKLEDYMLPNFMALITELARELGDDAIEKTDPAGRANILRNMLAKERALLVIDNLETFDERERVRLYQFLALLPQSCKAIVTSRRRSDVDARAIRLDRMERSEVLALLEELAKNRPLLKKATEQERNDLYEITNGNPLLIKWTVGQLGRGHCRTVAEAIDFLANAPKDNDPLEYIFGDLLGSFTESEKAVLVALTYFTLPASIKWIAETAGIAEQAAQTALEDLADRALLLATPDAEKYLLPPLAATFLRRKCPELLAKAGERLTDSVYALVMENGGKKFEKFPKIETEWQAIADALPLFLQGENRRLQHLFGALNEFLNFTGRWDEELMLGRQAEAVALAENDIINAGWRAYELGYTNYLRKNSNEVTECALRCIELWGRTPLAGSIEKAYGIRLQALANQLLNNYKETKAGYKRVLSILRSVVPNTDHVALAFNDLAIIERLLGNLQESERYYHSALRIAKKINSKEDIAVNTINLAQLALDRNQWRKAEELAKKSLGMAEELGRQELIGGNCLRLAQALSHRRKFQEAFPYAHRAVEIYTRLKMPEELAEALAALAECGG